jgi:hypothetical protein
MGAVGQKCSPDSVKNTWLPVIKQYRCVCVRRYKLLQNLILKLFNKGKLIKVEDLRIMITLMEGDFSCIQSIIVMLPVFS